MMGILTLTSSFVRALGINFPRTSWSYMPYSRFLISIMTTTLTRKSFEIFAGIQDDDGGENGAGLEEDDLIQMIDEVDTDNDGRISFAEFMVALGEKNVGKVAGAVRRNLDADNRAKRVQENS